MNPTVVGLFSILVWGFSIPFMRLIEEKIGPLGFGGSMFLGMGLVGCIAHRLWRRPWPKALFSNPYFYGRWIFFVLHEGLLLAAIFLVRKEHIPFVILLNYLWPTAIILCSVPIAGVKVTRRGPFYVGLLVVVTALSIEMLGSDLSGALFARGRDCLGYALVFVGAVSWGLYSAFSRRAANEAGGSAVTPFFQLTLALALPISFLPQCDHWDHLTHGMAWVLAGYCVLQFLAFLSWDFGVRHGNLVVLSLCADFIPWLSLLAAHLLLGAAIGEKTIASALLLVSGAMITRYGTQPKKLRVIEEDMPAI